MEKYKRTVKKHGVRMWARLSWFRIWVSERRDNGLDVNILGTFL
jgi:hypothetical protein